MELDKAIQERKSVRKFSNKKPDWRDIIEAIDSARYSPMSGNNYSLRFVLIDNKEKIKKLAEASQQSFVATAQYVVIVLTDPNKTLSLFEDRAQKYLKLQAGAAIENFLLKIQEYGLSSCWVGHFVDYLVRETIKAPENLEVEAILPVGYEQKPGVAQRRKIDLNRIIYFNEYGNKWMKENKIINA